MQSGDMSDLILAGEWLLSKESTPFRQLDLFLLLEARRTNGFQSEIFILRDYKQTLKEDMGSNRRTGRVHPVL